MLGKVNTHHPQVELNEIVFHFFLSSFNDSFDIYCDAIIDYHI